MKSTIFLFLIITTILAATTITTNNAYAQQSPPPLGEDTKTIPQAPSSAPPQQQISLGKVTIQISQTEQIVIDLPFKSDNKYQIVPIK